MPSPRPLIITALIALAVLLAGCGSGGGGSASTTPASGGSGSTTVDGITFSARSDDLSAHPFGLPFGIRTYRTFKDDVPTEYFVRKTFTGSVVGGIATLKVEYDYVDAQGTPITGNPLIDFIEHLQNAVNSNTSMARADDGALYIVGIAGTAIRPILVYPAQLSVGLEWTFAPLEPLIAVDPDEPVDETPETYTMRILSLDATAPRTGTTGCILLRQTTSEAGEPDRVRWSYSKPGVGFIEDTNVDPEQADQSTADGEFLVPTAG